MPLELAPPELLPVEPEVDGVLLPVPEELPEPVLLPVLPVLPVLPGLPVLPVLPVPPVAALPELLPLPAAPLPALSPELLGGGVGVVVELPLVVEPLPLPEEPLRLQALRASAAVSARARVSRGVRVRCIMLKFPERRKREGRPARRPGPWAGGARCCQ